MGTCPTGAFIMRMNADNNATVASKTVNELTLEDLEVVDLVLVLHASRRKLGVENARDRGIRPPVTPFSRLCVGGIRGPGL